MHINLMVIYFLIALSTFSLISGVIVFMLCAADRWMPIPLKISFLVGADISKVQFIPMSLHLKDGTIYTKD